MTRRTAIVSGLSAVAIVIALALLRAQSQPPLQPNARADSVLVEKSKHRLVLMLHGRILRVYKVALGRGGLAAKSRQGDALTPEGLYRIDARNPKSAFHYALHINYPSQRDIAAAKASGVDPGGAIMIHGLRNHFAWLGPWHRLVDWTNGCIAVTDPEMDEIARAIPDGTPIEIRA